MPGGASCGAGGSHLCDLKTASSGKDYPVKVGFIGVASRYTCLEKNGSMSKINAQYGNTRDTTDFCAIVQQGGFDSFGWDEETVKAHQEKQDEAIQIIKARGEELALAMWANPDMLSKGKQDMVKDFIEDNDTVKKLAKAQQPKASGPAALLNFPNLKRKWLRKVLEHFPVTSDYPALIKAKAKAYKSVYKNNKKTDECKFSPIPVVDVMGKPLNGGISEMIEDEDGMPLYTKKQAVRYVQAGDLVQIRFAMKVWVVNQNCGIKLHLVHVKKLVDGPGESSGFGDDNIDMSHYAAMGSKRAREDDAQAIEIEFAKPAPKKLRKDSPAGGEYVAGGVAK